MAILSAALELVGEVGYAGLTIEGIAARSGTGKQTVYRWWPSKADVLFDALALKADLFVPVADAGSYAADLRAFLDASFALGRDGRVIEILRGLMTHAQLDDAFGDRFRAGFIQRRRDALGLIIDRASRRGDLPAVPSPALVPDIVFGIIWYRLLTAREPATDDLTTELLRLLTTPGR